MKAPSFSIGKSPKKPREGPIYNYMHSKNDKLELNEADIKRRNSVPSVRIGVDKRVKFFSYDSSLIKEQIK